MSEPFNTQTRYIDNYETDFDESGVYLRCFSLHLIMNMILLQLRGLKHFLKGRVSEDHC